jgi:hypothetical protein
MGNTLPTHTHLFDGDTFMVSMVVKNMQYKRKTGTLVQPHTDYAAIDSRGNTIDFTSWSFYPGPRYDLEMDPTMQTQLATTGAPFRVLLMYGPTITVPFMVAYSVNTGYEFTIKDVQKAYRKNAEFITTVMNPRVEQITQNNWLCESVYTRFNAPNYDGLLITNAANFSLLSKLQPRIKSISILHDAAHRVGHFIVNV